ncbi:hypothetical protein [Lactiplantibacillus plantarum]|uniref:hypothetical protein n=1 Tax=Lactiplantibacillus plantarum TaxID=1590 RepID=UPI001CCC023A|nr:hypothetical protein [Lactiplantibacillus plantarum]
MELLNTSISYNIDELGNTSSVVAGIHGEADGRLKVTANITLYPTDLEQGNTFDDLSKKQLFALASKKLPTVLTKLSYSNYQFFVQNDVPVRVTAYSDISETGTYVTLNATLTSTDFDGHDDLTTVGYSDIKTTVSKIVAKEFAASPTEV